MSTSENDRFSARTGCTAVCTTRASTDGNPLLLGRNAEGGDLRRQRSELGRESCDLSGKTGACGGAVTGRSDRSGWSHRP